MCFYFGHVLGHAFQELKSCLRLVKVLIGEIVRKNYDLIYCLSEPFPHVRLIKLI